MPTQPHKKYPPIIIGLNPIRSAKLPIGIWKRIYDIANDDARNPTVSADPVYSIILWGSIVTIIPTPIIIKNTEMVNPKKALFFNINVCLSLKYVLEKKIKMVTDRLMKDLISETSRSFSQYE